MPISPIEVVFSRPKDPMNILKFLNPFKQPEAKDMAEKSLLDYQRQLLNHEETAAYSTKMAEFYREGIARLTHQSHSRVTTVD